MFGLISKRKLYQGIVSYGFSTKSTNQIRKFRNQINSSYNLQDFTKNYDANVWINKKISEQKEKVPTEKFSAILKRTKKEKLSPYFKADKRQFNKYLRQRSMQVIAKTEESDMKLLSESLFTKDHTAQSLENLRKIRENRIFNKKMHELAERKFALKLEGRKIGNLIENYEMKFLNYEKHNGSEGVGSKTYDLIDFFPESKNRFGENLETENKLYKEQLSGVVSNKYVEYKENKKRLENIRITSMLSGKKNNEELGRYLELINSPEKDDLIKTLTDEKDEQNEVAIPENPTKNKIDMYFTEHCELTNKINQFENSIYEEFKKLDLYNKYNKGIVEFKDLTLEENLNYIKFNINCGRDLFKMFHEVKDLSPIISCALIQKIAVGYKEERDILELFIKPEYRAMLSIAKKNLTAIDNKNLVDTLWAIGKIHKGNRNFSNKFFQHLLDEMLIELSTRIEELTFFEISFLVEGLAMLRIKDLYDDLKVVEEEYKLATLCKNRILGNKTYNDMVLHPYHIAKVLNYFYNKNDEDMEKLLVHVGKPLLNFIQHENIKETTHIIDLVKVIQVYAFGIAKGTQMKKSIIGDEEGTNVEIVTKTNEPIAALVTICQSVLEKLKPFIIANQSKCEIKHAANLIYSYSIAGLKDEDIYRHMQKQLDEQLITLQEFKPEDIMFYTFGMAKKYLKEHIPNFNLDPNGIIFPNLNEKVTSGRFITLKKFQKLMFEREKMFNAKYLSLVLYSSAMMGYSDMEFYLPIFNNIMITQNQYSLRPEDIGYLVQTLALLNYNDDNIIMFLLNKIFSNLDNILKEPRNVFSLSQVLTGLVRLNARKQIRSLVQWQEMMSNLINYTMVNLGDNVNYLISFMWFFSYMGIATPNMLDFLFTNVSNNKDKLGRYDSILLNHIYNYNNIYNNDLPSSLIDHITKKTLDFERLRQTIHLKLSTDRYETETPFKRIGRLLKENKSLLHKHGMAFEVNVVLMKSYIIPFLFGKKCLFVLDHTDILKTKIPTGYNVLTFEMILELDYEPRYINTVDILNKSDKEVFDIIFNKLT
jgi:hypothetical protein